MIKWIKKYIDANKSLNEFVAFEHFVNSPDNIGWHQLIAYLQNNSKLIQNIFENY